MNPSKQYFLGWRRQIFVAYFDTLGLVDFVDLESDVDFVDFDPDFSDGWLPFVMEHLDWECNGNQIVQLGLFQNRIYRESHLRASGAMEKSVHTREYRILIGLLREVREKASITQIELANQLQETQSYVSKCERGERRIDVVQLRYFCRALGIKFCDFVAEFERRILRR